MRVAWMVSIGLVAGCAGDDAGPSLGAGSTDAMSESSGGSDGAAETSTGAEPPPGRDHGPQPTDLPPTTEPAPRVQPLPPPDHGPQFVDVTAAAGLVFDPGAVAFPPDCKLDSAWAPGPGDYCIPERFLGAAAVGDFDGDDRPDVFLSRLDGPGRLMRNLGDGTFEDVTVARGLVQSHLVGGVAWVDIEGDGDLDLLHNAFADTRNYLYVNDGRGFFTEEAVARGVALDTGDIHVGTSIAVGDYDLDGWVDLFVADWHPDLLGSTTDFNRLLHNLGPAAPGHFEDVTAAMGIDLRSATFQVGGPLGVHGFSPTFVDLDGDGWPELTLVADYGESLLFDNQAGVSFKDVTSSAAVATEANGMGSTFGDVDGDGDLDWFVTSIYYAGFASGNRLYRNDGDLQFADVTDALGVREGGWGWGAVFFDADLDGDLDLTMAAGWPNGTYQENPVRLWLGGAPGPWPEVAAARGIDFRRGGRGVVPFDYDGDGDLDLLVHANTEPPALYRNDITDRASLQVRVDDPGSPNPRGLGAVVRVQATEGGPWQVRHVGVGGALFGQAEAEAHFGLGAHAGPVHRVEVELPASGQLVTYEDVAVGRLVVSP